MLYRRHRLQTRISREFFANAACWNFSWGRVLYQLRPEMEVAQATFLAPKRLFPLSVQRHLVKRHVSEMWRPVMERLPPGIYVVFLNQKAVPLTLQIATQDIDKFCRRCLSVQTRSLNG